jgi:hypothetical protein
MNFKGCGRKLTWLNLRYHSGICLEGLKETTKKTSQYTRCPKRASNLGLSEYKSETLLLGWSCPLYFGIHKNEVISLFNAASRHEDILYVRFCHQTELSGQPHNPVALCPQKEHVISIVYEPQRAQERSGRGNEDIFSAGNRPGQSRHTPVTILTELHRFFLRGINGRTDVLHERTCFLCWNNSPP